MTARSVSKPAGSNYRKTTLKNGLRVVTEQLPLVRSISIGVWVDVGSRHESETENGLSHFVEHLVFKGTRKRTAKQIASTLESLGGSLNAFTTKEHTCYTARVLDEHLVQAIDVLSDLTCHATFSPTNMKRESQVICEEIKESLDTPTDHIHDIFARAFWGEHPLGQPIMGAQDTIMNMTRARLTGFVKKHYRSGSVIVAASGAVSHDRLVRLVRESFNFERGQAGSPVTGERPGSKRAALEAEVSSQTQFCVGFPGIAYGHEGRTPMMALTSHLGSGMSSVLFQKIREQRGLAYSVYCYHDYYIDSGIFGVYLGTDKTHLRQAFDVILAECRRMKKRKLTSAQLEKVKSLLKGHLTIGMESTSNRMVRLGRQEILGQEYVPLDQTIKAIDKITASEVLGLANNVFDESQMTIAALGPVEDGSFDDVA